MAGKLLTLEEAAQKLGVSVEDVHSLIDRKKLYPLRDGNTLKFKHDEIERLATSEGDSLALGDSGWYSRLLASRPVVWLGEISYEIFLVHLVLMEVAMTEVLHWTVYTGNTAGLLIVTMALSIPVAWVLHRFTRVRS